MLPAPSNTTESLKHAHKSSSVTVSSWSLHSQRPSRPRKGNPQFLWLMENSWKGTEIAGVAVDVEHGAFALGAFLGRLLQLFERYLPAAFAAWHRLLKLLRTAHFLIFDFVQQLGLRVSAGFLVLQGAENLACLAGRGVGVAVIRGLYVERAVHHAVAAAAAHHLQRGESVVLSYSPDGIPQMEVLFWYIPQMEVLFCHKS